MTYRACEFFRAAEVEAKLASLDGALHEAFASVGAYSSEGVDGREELALKPWLCDPARSMPTLALRDLPVKKGFSSTEGQARLAHDLASIELQATELAVRTLREFPEAPQAFREELAEIARSEASHLRLCLRALDSLGHRFGDWPVHLALWRTVSADDSLIDRVIIVHRYLEGAGLDAGESIRRRLSGANFKAVREAVSVIANEEVGHVEFGSRWLRRLCEAEGLRSEAEFARLLPKLMREAPRRERLAREARARAGFSAEEMNAIEREQGRFRLDAGGSTRGSSGRSPDQNPDSPNKIA